ncbi:ABC transporter permease [candidate division KSB1 bacterium]
MMQKDKYKKQPLSFLLLRLLLPDQDRNPIYGNFELYYKDVLREKGRNYAWFWIFGQILKSAPGLLSANLSGSFTMYRSYLKIAFRNIKRNKGYSFINIAGLTVGVACSILISLYIGNELSYDNYHNDKDRLFRIGMEWKNPKGTNIYPSVGPLVVPYLKQDYAEVENAACIWMARKQSVEYNGKIFYEELFMFASEDLFNVLTIPLLQGDPKSCLERPNTVVVSQRIADKYFSNEDPMGKSISIDGGKFEVTGIAVNSPENTHLKYDLIASLESFNFTPSWYWTGFYSYLKLKKNVDKEVFGEKIRKLADNYFKKELDAGGYDFTYFLQPVPDIHLRSQLQYEIEPPGNISYIYLFAGISILILIVAGINFVNLTTARSVTRAKEIGIRKVAGANRDQLIFQLLSESILISLIALFSALIIAYLAAPLINLIAGTKFTGGGIFQTFVLVISTGLTLFIGILAGIYPAFFISAFKPAAIMKGRVKLGTRGYGLRKLLVTGQFVISIILLISTIVIYQQINFMKNRPLGFSKEQKFILSAKGIPEIETKYETVRNELMKYSSISGVSFSSNVPGQKILWNLGTRLAGEDEGNKAGGQPMKYLFVDCEFIPEYDLEIIAGRVFNPEITSDLEGAFIINETALKKFGFNSPEEALGKKLKVSTFNSPVIGVIKDYHQLGMQEQIEPLVMQYMPDRVRYISLKINTGDLPGTLAVIEEKFREFFPEIPYESFFLDGYFDAQYRSEQRTAFLFTAVSSLGLFIACIGMLGLASFLSEQRRKEIGIRKVTGASTSGIFFLMSSEFIKCSAVGAITACPAAYFVSKTWLANFAFRITPGLLPFAAAIVFTVIVTILTVGYQSIKASTANPVDSLKCE